MTHSPRRLRPLGQAGQSLVEFALVAPVFLLMLFAIIQFGFLYGGQNALVNSAREAARYAAVRQAATSVRAGIFSGDAYTNLRDTGLPRSIPGFRLTNLITTGAKASAVCYVVRANPLPPTGGPTTYSVFVRVQIAYRHPLLFPFPPVDLLDGIADNAFRLGASEEMRVENTLLSQAPTGLPTCP